MGSQEASTGADVGPSRAYGADIYISHSPMLENPTYAHEAIWEPGSIHAADVGPSRAYGADIYISHSPMLENPIYATEAIWHATGPD